MIYFTLLIASLTLKIESKEDGFDNYIENNIKSLQSQAQSDMDNYNSALGRLKINLDKYKDCLESVITTLNEGKFQDKVGQDDLNLDKYGKGIRTKEMGKSIKNKSSYLAKKFSSVFNKIANKKSNPNKKTTNKPLSKKQMWKIIEDKDDKDKNDIKRSLFSVSAVKICFEHLKNTNKEQESKLKIDSTQDYKRLHKQFSKTLLQQDYNLRASYTKQRDK